MRLLMLLCLALTGCTAQEISACASACELGGRSMLRYSGDPHLVGASPACVCSGGEPDGGPQ